MARRGKDLLLSALPFLLFFSPSASSGQSTAVHDINNSTLRRTDFPDGFVFGASSSAYQYEGGAREGGRGPTIWDTFTHQYPEKISDQSNGDVALDSYHRYKEDVMLMKDMGMDSYRFSISWSRILPNGSLSGGINAEGIKYYNNLINFILHNGLTPFATILHFDPPQGLDDAYGGFLSKNIAKDFSDYAEICFREFGDRVKHWVTINEPYVYSVFGYATGVTAPGRCSPSVNTKCTGGESGTEPYVVGHNILLAHAAVVKLYREKYNKGPNKGVIGITLMVYWFVPLDDSKSSSEAAGRALDFMYGWFMDPLTEGDYPFIMRILVGNRLPKFTKEESEMIKGSFDFIGINYYTAKYVSSLPFLKIPKPTYQFDSYTNTTAFRNGKPIGPRAGSSWLYIYPPGLKELLLYTKIKYNSPTIYITENGIDEVNNVDLALEEAVDDDMRLKSYKEHLHYVIQAMSLGVDVRGFFAWSLLDNFEWNEGYTVRFGLFYVDYKDGLKRYPKKSALWFKSLLKSPIKLMETM